MSLHRCKEPDGQLTGVADQHMVPGCPGAACSCKADAVEALETLKAKAVYWFEHGDEKTWEAAQESILDAAWDYASAHLGHPGTGHVHAPPALEAGKVPE